MADEPSRAVSSQLRRLVGRRNGCTLTDAQLLENFVSRRDEASFEVLVWRHGTMVLGLCRRILHDSHEAEDAFQATFLVFARKAGSIGKREAVGGWLYKVAYRVALRLRARAARRSAREAPADDLPARDSADAVLWRDLRPVLDEAIDHLPEKYRVPIVLCYLQGRTNEEAAEQLGCPKGTILSRLARGRERLRSRLTRLGLALSAAGLAAALSQNTAAAAPAALVSATVQAAIPFAAGQAAAGLVSASVAALTEGVLRAMFLTKVKIGAAALLALAVLGTGAGLFTHRALADRPPPGAKEAVADRPADKGADRPADKADPRTSREDSRSPDDVTGRVVAVARDGKSFTLEIPPRERGDEPKKVEVKLDGKTDVVYHGVGTDGAKPTEGYLTRVRLKDGATSVGFQGSATAGRRSADVAGKVTAVAKDGKGVTLAVEPARGRGDDAREAKVVDLPFNDKTVVRFDHVARGEAKLTEGYYARVWLEDGARGAAAVVELSGKEQKPAPRKQPEVAGAVVAVGKDGKSFTLATPPKERGEEPQKIEIKLTDQTTALYYSVPTDGAKLAEGLQALVWLAEGSKDVADRVTLRAVRQERWARIEGKVVGVSKDGKTVTLEGRPEARGEDPKKSEVRLTDKTQVAYFGVGPDEARPTEGYFAQVELADGSKEVAFTVLFTKPGGDRRR